MFTNSEKLSQLIVTGMQGKKAINIVVLDLRKIKSAVSDFFVICSGNSATQIEAISNSIDELVFNSIKENPWHIEGRENKEWILLDYITVVAHIFQGKLRSFYKLENLWGDAEIKEIKE